jgi:hypothetical protein
MNQRRSTRGSSAVRHHLLGRSGSCVPSIACRMEKECLGHGGRRIWQKNVDGGLVDGGTGCGRLFTPLRTFYCIGLPQARPPLRCPSKLAPNPWPVSAWLVASGQQRRREAWVLLLWAGPLSRSRISARQIRLEFPLVAKWWLYSDLTCGSKDHQCPKSEYSFAPHESSPKTAS